MVGLLREHCYFTRYLYKLGLVKSNESDRCQQASVMASHVFCDCETMVALRYRHLGWQIMKPGDQEKISVNWILHFV